MVVLAFAEGGGIQLVPDGSILIHIGLILLMIFVLNRTFFRPINRVIQSREKHKGGHSSEADAILSQVAEKTSRFEAEMRGARAEGHSLIEAEREVALAERESRVETVKSEVEQRVASEKSVIARQTEEARQQIVTEAKVLAEKISSNILK